MKPTVGRVTDADRFHSVACRAFRLTGGGKHIDVPFLLGLAVYVFVISGFDVRQLVVGRGDHWITGGALAISALAAGRITLSAHAQHYTELNARTTATGRPEGPLRHSA